MWRCDMPDYTKEQISGVNDIANRNSEDEINIQNRNTSIVGKPPLIYNTSYGKLSLTQQRILDKLKDNKLIKIEKHKENISIDMKDMSSLTAYSGLEYSLFERNDMYVVVEGTSSGMTLKTNDSAYLINNRFKWIGHTHPGSGFNCLIPSDDDYETLKKFNQKRSVIYNSIGEKYIFELEE
jgi:hypothetical protein